MVHSCVVLDVGVVGGSLHGGGSVETSKAWQGLNPKPEAGFCIFKMLPLLS